MHAYEGYKCDQPGHQVGVDLNRNWGFKFGIGDDSGNACVTTYRGPEPFSEPETRAVRDFVFSKRNELKFVYNFHCFGNMWFIPSRKEYNRKEKERKFEQLLEVFHEIATEATFPRDEDLGPSEQNLGIIAGGDAGEWISHNLLIPATEAELGDKSQYTLEWMPNDSQTAFSIITENYKWLEYTFDKMGNHIQIEPLGFTRQNASSAVLLLNVTNHGLAD